MKQFYVKKIFSRVLPLFLFIAAVVIIPSCVKDNFDFEKLSKTEWNPNIAVPLVYSSLSINDMISGAKSSGLITVGSDNFCTVYYKSNLFSLTAADLITIPNNQPPPYTASLTSGQVASFNFAGTVTVPYSQTISFDTGVNGPKIDSATFKTGDINISLNSDFKCSGQIVLTLPAAKKNGVPFSQTITFTYSGSTPVIANSTFNLAGYSFDMTSGGTAFNQFTANFDVTLTSTGATISSSDQITLTQSLNNMHFEKIFGDIGQMSLSPDPDSVDIGIFKNALGQGSFTLADPRIKVLISNSYGLPVNATIAQFDGYTPGSAPFAITGCPSPLPIQSPSFAQVGQMLTDSFSLNSGNSNFASVINNTPKYLIYKINSLTNPAGGTTHNNFVLDTSRFKVDMEVEIPLWGTAMNFVLQDTVPFSFGAQLPSEIESAILRTYNSNGFPFDVDLQIYFADTLYNKLDSLIIPNQLILKSGIVNLTTGKVTSPTSTVYDANLTASRMANLKPSKFLLIKAIANTANGGTTNVKIYSDYKVDVKIGMQVQVKAKI